MMSLLLIILFLVISPQQDSIKTAKPIGTNITSTRDMPNMARGASITGYNEDYSMEAAKDGWGTSKWDKGTYRPGMDLEKVRKKERDAHYSRLATIIGVLCGIAAGVYVVVFLVREERQKKKKKNPWRDSSFTSDY